MKNILLTNLLFIAILTNAQFRKGDKYLGGTFSISVQGVPNSPNGGATSEANSFGIDPSIGFLMNEKFAIGGHIGYDWYHQKSTNFSSSNENNSNSFSTGLHARRYFKISENFLFSVVGFLGFNRGVVTSISTYNLPPQQGTSENKTKEYQLWTSIVPGFMFFPSPRWAFEVSVGSIGQTQRRSLSTHAIQNTFYLRYGIISFGLFYYFRKSSK